MRDLVLERVRRPDCRMFGVILDGYPPSREDLANLRAQHFTPDHVFFLECDDATSIARQVARKARSTIPPRRRAVAVFHRADEA
jgi:adenylate kinase family enzyme